MAGKLYLIPCPIVEYHVETIPTDTIKILHSVKCFIVERARTARRYISKTKPPHPIDSLDIIEMDKHSDKLFDREMLSWLSEGKDVGIISESGCPGIADPGAKYVSIAQSKGYTVLPLVGPSSILMSLMASGMTGQNFAFIGYLPAKSDALQNKLRQLSKAIQSNGQSQIFIETPYRNDKLLSSILKEVDGHVQLCIAIDITSSEQSIKTKSISLWKKDVPRIGKRNCIFILGRATY